MYKTETALWILGGILNIFGALVFLREFRDSVFGWFSFGRTDNSLIKSELHPVKKLSKKERKKIVLKFKSPLLEDDIPPNFPKNIQNNDTGCGHRNISKILNTQS